MTDREISEEEIRKTDQYLKGYKTYRRFLQLDRYEKEFFGYEDPPEEVGGDVSMAGARMYAIRQFILNLPNSDEKLLLYYYYVRGESVERCGELLGISRAGAYRLKRRALILAARRRGGAQ